MESKLSLKGARLPLSVRVKFGPNVDKIVGSGEFPEKISSNDMFGKQFFLERLPAHTGCTSCR